VSAPLVIEYPAAVEEAVAVVLAAVCRAPAVAAAFPERWLALELLEDGDDLRRRIVAMEGGAEVVAAADRARAAVAGALGAGSVVAVAGGRYEWIHRVVADVVDRPADTGATRSDRIDRVLTHRLGGIPLFLAAMWVVFKLTADVSSVFLDWVDAVVSGPISRWAAAGVTAVGLGGTWVEGLVVDGVIAGVGGILVFVPVLMTLFGCLAVLEDSGYMARAALVMDRTMRRLGLPGKSFLPMLVGFGCSVPAVYATRTLERREDRILTGLLVPFMSCAARLPVYVLFASVFFTRNRGAVVFAMYLLGLVVALALGIVVNRGLLGRRGALPLVMELPAYRRPVARDVWSQVARRTAGFIRDAGTIILGTSVVLWLMMAIPLGGGRFGEVPVDDSLFGRGAAAVAPVLAPAGFGSWEAAGSLATGFVAKEVVVTSMAQIHGVSEPATAVAAPSVGDDLREIGGGLVTALRDTVLTVPSIVGVDLVGEGAAPGPEGLMGSVRVSFEESSGGHGAAAGLAFMVFVLLYTPCAATVAAQRRELGARWMWVSVAGQTAVAWTLAVVVFQVGRLLG
jgi:ferrous iron transport protein B